MEQTSHLMAGSHRRPLLFYILNQSRLAICLFSQINREMLYAIQILYIVLFLENERYNWNIYNYIGLNGFIYH